MNSLAKTPSPLASTVLILQRLYCAFLLLGGIVWALDVFVRMGFSLIAAEWLGPYLGVGVAAAFLLSPYASRRRAAGWLEILLGLASIASWSWMALNYNDWLFDVAGHTPEKYLPGMLAIGLMVEGLRKSCGLPLALLVWVLILYGLFGSALPGAWEADRLSPPALVMYLYTDSNAIPGLVLVIIASLVLAFIVFGKLMEVSGATSFFTDIAMSVMGHKRGGPAKVSVIASGMMGSISGSPVGNVMSTGVMTIPLMQRTGFRAHQAAAIEAVAPMTGGAIRPPVMGATAFLMAEFLQVSYMDVVLAALLPAILYYLCLFMQVDAMARREGLEGIPREELPRALPVLKRGWVFVVPLALLIYLLFWRNFTPALAALSASGVLLILALLRKRFLNLADWKDFIFSGGAAMVPLVLIGGGAGVVVGIMSVTGLGQSLAFVLVQVGTQWGLFVMLLITAFLSIILGMGMPATAIYVVLATMIAPALVEMGVAPMAAHMFIFYFGVLSFLTPPVAVSSYVAAGLAGANMWNTSLVGLRLSAIAFLLPFLWAYDPALLLRGGASWLAVLVVICTTLVAILLLTRGAQLLSAPGSRPHALGALALALVVAVGTAPIWLGHESLLALLAAAIGLAIFVLLRKPAAPPVSVTTGTSPEIQKNSSRS